MAVRDDGSAENRRQPPDRRSGRDPRIESMKTILIAAALVLSTATAALEQQAAVYCSSNSYQRQCYVSQYTGAVQCY
ncbi:MAG TPA: hypothetical protein VIN40_00610 [Candidatus Tyrphobacter sp.]